MIGPATPTAPRLRPYQSAVLDEILPDLWRRGIKSVILTSPVGSGKTVIATELARRTEIAGKSDVWFLAHRSELIQQPSDKFRAAGIRHEVVQAGQWTVTPDGWSGSSTNSPTVRIGSIQTVSRRGERTVGQGDSVLVIIDECHRARANTYTTILQWFSERYRRVYLIGLTATPYRLDGKPLGDIADALVEVATPRQLIADGHICKPVVYAGSSPDTRGVHRRAGDFVPEELERRANTPRLVADIVETWHKKADGLPTVGFAMSIAHSLHLVERFAEAGVRVAHIDGTTSREVRSRTLARLAIGGLASSHPEALDVVLNVGVLTEGWDSESDYRRVLEDPTLWVDSDGLATSYPPEYRPLCVLGDYAPTLSMCAYRQREGRVCRTHPRKARAIVLSHSGNVVDDRGVRHGWLEQHEGFTLEGGMIGTGPDGVQTAPSSTKGPRAITPAHCGACLAVWPPGTQICGACGEPLANPDESDWRERRGELVEVSAVGEERPATPHEKLTFLSAQHRQAAMKGFKEFWVWKRFESRFGRFPDFELNNAARREAGLAPKPRREVGNE